MKVTRIEPSALAPIAAQMDADGFDTDGDGAWYAVVDGDTLVGTGRARDIAGNTLIDDVWIVPERRGNGYGTALMQVIAAEHPRAWLICDPDNVSFYERCGFRTDHDLPEALTAHWATTGDWPSPPDHEHFPMRLTR